MVYYEYIFYKTYKFFFRMSAQDMPGFKATLITGFFVFLNCFMPPSSLLNLAGRDITSFIGMAGGKTLVVAIILSSWIVNYWLFWRNGKLPQVLLKFEERTVPFNQRIATLSLAVFYWLPVVLFVLLAIRGAHIRG